jgi:hypothetical protein
MELTKTLHDMSAFILISLLIVLTSSLGFHVTPFFGFNPEFGFNPQFSSAIQYGDEPVEEPQTRAQAAANQQARERANRANRAVIVARSEQERAADARSQQNDYEAQMQLEQTIFAGLKPEEIALVKILFNNRAKIERKVINTPSGVITRTTSEDSQVKNAIETHVVQMFDAVNRNAKMLHHDPLMVQLGEEHVKNSISATRSSIPFGVQVTHRGTNPCAVNVIQKHAAIVSELIKSGAFEAMKRHSIPESC